MRQLGIGIIGCGGIANAKHIPNLLKEPRVSIRAVCDVSGPDRMQKTVDSFSLVQCKQYDNVDALLEDEAIDVVHICTPNAWHAPLAIQALRAGKHVMCEKPMATTVADAEEMVRVAHECGRILTVCANNRFREDSWVLKRCCAQGLLGDVYYAKATYLRRRGVPTWGAFTDQSIQGGGPVIDIGTHALDLAFWLMDNHEPLEVFSTTFDYLKNFPSVANPYGMWDITKFTTEDSGVGLIRMMNGALVLLEASWLMNIRKERQSLISLYGTKAGADMDDGLFINGEICGNLYDQKIQTDQQGVAFYKPTKVFGPELEIHTWIDSILNKEAPVVKPEEMVVVMRTIRAFYQSAERKQVVRIEGVNE